MDEDLSPAVIRKCVHLATKLPSFRSAQESIAETLEVELTTKRVERLAKRIGQARVYERDTETRRWEALPLSAKLAAPPGVKPPRVACVSYDGGRMQRCDLPKDAKSHWCETNVGILLELEASSHEGDPCPELPSTFRNLAKMNKLTREIHLVAAEKTAPKGEVFKSVDVAPTENKHPPNKHPPTENPPPDPRAKSREAAAAAEEEVVVFEPPKVESRDVAASLSGSRDFGKQLAARAWSLGFTVASKKAFVGDGGTANWGIWKRHFKHLDYVPILDFIHALTYVYAAAMADRAPEEGGPIFLRWITWVWQGEVSRVIAEVAARSVELGKPPAEASETDPRKVVATTLTYLVNQQLRMNYPQYRQAGLPVTSSHIESAIKQINQRVKGSEKFWTAEGGEALLQLRADSLSNTQPLPPFWARRSQNATGTRTYTKAA